MRLGLGLGLQYKNKTTGGTAAPATDFRMVVNTANTGASNNDQFQFTGALGDYDVEVYDSTGTTLQETITGLSGAATITIAAGAGTYELRVFPAATNGFNRIQFNNGGDKLKLLEVRNWGEVKWTTLGGVFFGCSNLTSITSLIQPDFSLVDAITSGFRNLTSLTTLQSAGWNLPNCTNAQSPFAGTNALSSLDLSNWNMPICTNFFLFALSCSSLQSVNMTGFTAPLAQSYSRAFDGCIAITDVIGIEDLSIGNVTNFTDFLKGVTLPTSRYDALLINYEAQAPNTGLSFNGGNSKYTAGGAAETARTSLATTYSWTITDGGSV